MSIYQWRSRKELIRDVLLWTPIHGRAKAGRPARTYIQQLCEDTGCCPEDLPRAMNDREEWRERVRDIRATSAIWWWWWHIYAHTHTYIYQKPASGLMSRVFTNGLEDLGSIPGWVIPKTQKKWYLMPPCLTLSNIRYRSRVKWSNLGKGVVPSPTPWCSSYQRSLRVALDYGR